MSNTRPIFSLDTPITFKFTQVEENPSSLPNVQECLNTPPSSPEQQPLRTRATSSSPLVSPKNSSFSLNTPITFKFTKVEEDPSSLPDMQACLNTPPSSPEQSLRSQQETIEKIQSLAQQDSPKIPFLSTALSMSDLNAFLIKQGEIKMDPEVGQTLFLGQQGMEERIQLLKQDDYSAYKTSATRKVFLSSSEEAKEILRFLDEKAPPLNSSAYSKYDPKKDRYQDTRQPKATMVKVYDKDLQQVDYNGAEFINSVNGQKYILMQGPLDWTFYLTQDVMKQNNVRQMVCLTKEMEGTKIKCYPYWENWVPTEKSGFTLRTPGPNEGWGTLEMFHYEKWPDQGTPQNINEFLEFVAWQRKEHKEGTIAVHCSAGVGRTGVFMVVTLMLDLIEQGAKELNPIELVALLRRYRPKMVQNADQLIFCYDIANRLLSK